MKRCYKMDRECNDDCVAFRSVYSPTELECMSKNSERSMPLPHAAFGSALRLLPIDMVGTAGETFCFELYLRNQEVLALCSKPKRKKP